MTAGKVMSAIKVDMCRRRQQQQQHQSTNSAANSASISIVATAAAAAATATLPTPAAAHSAGVATLPNILDAMRTQRQRRPNGVRTCLFGVPEPGSTQKLYREMLAQQQDYMLQRYQFDMVTEKYVGPAEDRLQQRLLAEDQTQDAAKDETNAASCSSAAQSGSTSGTSSTFSATGQCGDDAVRVKPTKSTASLRHQAKPYDRPSAVSATANDVRPITEFFRKSKKTCPTAAALAAKLQPIGAEVVEAISETTAAAAEV